MPEDERDKPSAHAECVLTARFLSKDHREDLVTATANVGKLALSTARRKEYYDPKERGAFSELRVKGLIDSEHGPTERAWEGLDDVSLLPLRSEKAGRLGPA